MCIISAKPAGVAMPSTETLRTMWDANPDGAGFMYPIMQGGKPTGLVQIEKGFMKWQDFETAIETLSRQIDLTATALVMHFRITTHGGTCPELTHPFPVVSSTSVLKKIRSAAKVGIAHNGIISSVSPSKDMSDTSEYVRSQLAPLAKALPRFYENPNAIELIKNAIGSKMAILTPEGNIVTIGDFNVKDGVLYSNFSHEPRSWSYSTYGGGGWYDEWTSGASRKLMDVLDAQPQAHNIVLANGTKLPADSHFFSIDSRGRVYAFSDELGMFGELCNAKAVTDKGIRIAYNAKKAYYESVLTSEDLEFYGYDSCNPIEYTMPWYGDDSSDDEPI